jgi:hypothetical protein
MVGLRCHPIRIVGKPLSTQAWQDEMYLRAMLNLLTDIIPLEHLFHVY